MAVMTVITHVRPIMINVAGFECCSPTPCIENCA
jgi:hypothetical protein